MVNQGSLSLTIRSINKVNELSEVSELEKVIWQSDDPVPVAHAVTSVENGGMVIGAYIENKLIGFQYSFAGFNDGKSYLCSYILGIHPKYRINGIGEKLKLAQRTEAIKKGYDLISWTFDPLETINANLNIKKLGGICSTYIKNCYGEMNDGLNAGIPSDRFLVEWQIQDDHVIKKLSNQQEHIQYSNEHPSVIKVKINDGGFPVPGEVDCSNGETSDVLLVPVPGEFQKIKEQHPDLASEWRTKTRTAFTYYFQSGWQVGDFIKNEKANKDHLSTVHYYVMQKKE